jgi:hypothetical protein
MATQAKIFWLVESGPVSAPIYLSFVGENPYWVFDIHRAAKFTSSGNAQCFLDAVVIQSPLIEYRVAEHQTD